MPRGKRPASPKAETEPKRTGRPSKYDPAYSEQARKLCEQFGATDADLALFFKVDLSSIKRWMVAYPEFRAAVLVGKQVADDRVERSLYQRAVGYEHDSVKIFLPKDSRRPVYARFVAHVPPDVTAQIFWLKNRRKADWRDRPPEAAGEEEGGVTIRGGLPDA